MQRAGAIDLATLEIMNKGRDAERADVVRFLVSMGAALVSVGASDRAVFAIDMSERIDKGEHVS